MKITTDKLKEAEIEIRKYQYSQDLNLVASYYYPIETLQQEDSNGKTSLNKLEEEYQKYLLSK